MDPFCGLFGGCAGAYWKLPSSLAGRCIALVWVACSCGVFLLPSAPKRALSLSAPPALGPTSGPRNPGLVPFLTPDFLGGS